MLHEHINDAYVKWMLDLVSRGRFASYKTLLLYLDAVPFRSLLPNDANRAADGIDLRYRFALDFGVDPEVAMDILGGPCSVLEMMIALSIRGESFMDDPSVGDRTKQWFWGMIKSLGLDTMTDDKFDEHFVRDTIDRFLNREYSPDGRGGLFTIHRCEHDLRNVEIWWQLCWYLDNFT